MTMKNYDDQNYRLVKINPPSRFILEGTWSGYRSSQSRVVHREVISKKRAELLSNLSTIEYSDGTRLHITIRPAEYRERVKQILSYDTLIRKAQYSGLSYYKV